MILAHPLTHTSPSFVLGLFEPHIPRAIHHYCKQGDVIYDIGANIGYHALLFALYVGADGQVFAFEPNPADNKSLRWNLSANGFTNVEVIDMAVADTTGIVSFAVFAEPGVHHIASDHEPADASLISVPTITLDDFVYIRENPAPSFVKIDVEGSELHVLQGGSQMLREYQPVVIVEVWPETRHQVMEIMTDCGYHIIEEHYNYGDIADMVFLPDE
jgi:FkbM family methyltransferase